MVPTQTFLQRRPIKEVMKNRKRTWKVLMKNLHTKYSLRNVLLAQYGQILNETSNLPKNCQYLVRVKFLLKCHSFESNKRTENFALKVPS